jgi:hypothetical protein
MVTRTFSSSQETLAYLQQRFGSANYSSWQSGRKQFYSRVNYPAAGVTEAVFFSDAKGVNSASAEITNMPKANSFGQVHFLLKAIRCSFYMATNNWHAFTGADAYSIISDMVMGFVQSGVFELNINARPFVQLPVPFLYAPPGNGQPQLFSAGIQSQTLTEGTPNVSNTFVTATPYARQTSKARGVFLVDPNILIEAEQNFEAKISWPSGVVPVIATSVQNDSSNKLYLEVSLDGLLFRPVQ